MFKRFMFLAVLLCVGCDGTNSLIIASMQLSFAEQFATACPAGPAAVACARQVEEFSDQCFDKTLAQQAIAADRPQKADINATHIRTYQSCLATKSGTDYWKDKDMANHILSQAR